MRIGRQFGVVRVGRHAILRSAFIMVWMYGSMCFSHTVMVITVMVFTQPAYICREVSLHKDQLLQDPSTFEENSSYELFWFFSSY